MASISWWSFIAFTRMGQPSLRPKRRQHTTSHPSHSFTTFTFLYVRFHSNIFLHIPSQRLHRFLYVSFSIAERAFTRASTHRFLWPPTRCCRACRESGDRPARFEASPNSGKCFEEGRRSRRLTLCKGKTPIECSSTLPTHHSGRFPPSDLLARATSLSAYDTVLLCVVR